ncbi:hypothetical protein D3C72_1006890 [compost metagenome]
MINPSINRLFTDFVRVKAIDFHIAGYGGISGVLQLVFLADIVGERVVMRLIGLVRAKAFRRAVIRRERVEVFARLQVNPWRLVVQLDAIQVVMLDHQQRLAVVLVDPGEHERLEVFQDRLFHPWIGPDPLAFFLREAQHAGGVFVLEVQAVAQVLHQLRVALDEHRGRVSRRPFLRGIVEEIGAQDIIDGSRRAAF